MPTALIAFTPNQETGFEELAGAGVAAINVVIDAKGAVRRRPTVTAPTDLYADVIDSAGITGVHQSVQTGAVYVITAPSPASDVCAVAAGGYRNLSSASISIGGGRRPVIAETEALLLVTCGSYVSKVVLADNTYSLLGGQTYVTPAVITNASKVMVQNADYPGRLQYSDVAWGSSYTGHENWTTGVSGYFEAEARPDPILMVQENTSEVVAFGRTTTQYFQPDPNTTYAVMGTQEVGCIAPYSVVRHGQAFAWLDNTRNFVMSDGRNLERISPQLANTLQSMSTVSDCYGMRLRTGQTDVLAWTFPTDGRTFVYAPGGGWSEWASWSTATGNWASLNITAACQRHHSGKTLVGLSSGKLGELTFGTTDLGALVYGQVVTGFEARGTDARKHCRVVRLTLRRGEGGAASSAEANQVFVSYRDSLGAWEPEIMVSMGAGGDTANTVELRSLGVYRRRQWRFRFGGSSAVVLAAASEEYEVLQ